jgi:hypothetical protein
MPSAGAAMQSHEEDCTIACGQTQAYSRRIAVCGGIMPIIRVAGELLEWEEDVFLRGFMGRHGAFGGNSKAKAEIVSRDTPCIIRMSGLFLVNLSLFGAELYRIQAHIMETERPL